MQLIFATNNQHKVNEIKTILPHEISIITLKDAGIDIDIPEPHQTLEENAAEKGRTIFALTGKNCFGEDTGLEVAALHGAPGVYSARYAGEKNSPKENIKKLLHNLSSCEDRSAQFRTIVFLIFNNREYFFEGVCKGTISTQSTGSEGFGYDPVFIPHGSGKTFGQMMQAEKNIYSHRKKAIDKLVTFLNHMNLNR